MPASGSTARRSLPSGAVVLRRDADDDAGVGVALVVRVLAHAVGDDAARLRRRGDDRAARAHAEAVDRAAVAGVVHQLVVGGAEQRVAGVRAEARAVDQRLADARCESRSRTAWLRCRRRARAASRRCRARCGRSPARRGRRRCSLAASASVDAARRRPRDVATRLSMAVVDARPKRISPPSATMSARIFSTMPTRRKVPMCGLAT